MRVLVVCPHPDDEAIGCGGTIAAHSAGGDDVRAVFLTSGEAGGHGIDPGLAGPAREAEARASAELLGISELEFWRMPDGRLRSSSALVRRLVDAIEAWPAEVVYVPHGGEQHADHRAASRAVGQAVQALERQPEVWQFEVWTPLAVLDRIVDISDVLDVKLAAIRSYESQCSVLRFDEAFAGLARYRGEMHSWPGGPYAEVFAARR